MADSIPKILWDALAMIESEAPECYAAIAGALEGISVRLVAGETTVIVGEGGRLHEGLDGAQCGVEAAAESGRIRELVAGRDTITDAIRSGGVELRGGLVALSASFVAFEKMVGTLAGRSGAPALAKRLEEVE